MGLCGKEGNCKEKHMYNNIIRGRVKRLTNWQWVLLPVSGYTIKDMGTVLGTREVLPHNR